MRKFFSILLVLVFFISCIRTDESSDKFKATLIEKFKAKFLSYVSQYYSGKNLTHIGELQFDLLKLRNYECPSEHSKLNGVFDKSKNSSLFEMIQAKMSNNNESLQDEIIDDLNKIVSLLFFFFFFNKFFLI